MRVYRRSMTVGGDGTSVVAFGGGAVVARRSFERTAESVGSARLHLEDVLADEGVGDRDVVEAAVLLVSELGTDALQHGRWPEFWVTVTLSVSCVQVSVETAAEDVAVGPGSLPASSGHRLSAAPSVGAAPGAPQARSPGDGALSRARVHALEDAAMPDIAPHSRTIVEMVADSWDIRVAPRSRTAWFRLFR